MLFFILYKNFSPSIYQWLYITHKYTVVIIGHKWSTTHTVLKSHRSKMSVIYMLSWKHEKLVEHSLVHWYQQCVTVHHVPKCMSCHKAIVVITRRAHCFHDNIYIQWLYIYSGYSNYLDLVKNFVMWNISPCNNIT